MGVDVRVISITDFVRFDVTGDFDFLATKAVVSEVGKTLARAENTNILVDTRGATTKNLSAADVYSLVLHLLSFGPPQGNRLAILNDPKDEVDRGMLFSMGASRQGFDVASFQDFESAMEWLSNYQL
jgi:hypothetical protein